MTQDEPDITINGKRLSTGQAMAVRVAITNFHMEMSDPECQDEIGEIGAIYKARLGEVLSIILSGDHQ